MPFIILVCENLWNVANSFSDFKMIFIFIKLLFDPKLSTDYELIVDGANEIKWKPNRAVFFSRGERETWHSYAADGKSNRIALVYNLMTNNLKEVYRIEKKNFYLGFLRSRINHLLYRFFGILR